MDMAAAALLQSVASKLSPRAAAPTHHPCLVARGLHGGARSANSSHSNRQGTAGMGAAAGLRSLAGRRLMTKMSHAPPPPPPHRLLHGRGLHGRTSPDPIPSTPPKVLHTTAIAKARAGVAYITLFGGVIYLHFWVKPAQEEAMAMFETVYKQRSDLINALQGIIHTQRKMHAKLQTMHVSSVPETPSALASGTGVIDKLGKEEAVKTMHSQENHVKELEATIVDLKVEIAELKIALESACSQGKE